MFFVLFDGAFTGNAPEMSSFLYKKKKLKQLCVLYGHQPYNHYFLVCFTNKPSLSMIYCIFLITSAILFPACLREHADNFWVEWLDFQ